MDNPPTEVDSVSETINAVVGQLVEDFDPLRIVLFGSYARGDFDADSDLDFLVVMPDGCDRRQMAIAIHHRLKGLSLPKDVVVTTPAEIRRRSNLLGSVLRSALREGKVLYERH